MLGARAFPKRLPHLRPAVQRDTNFSCLAKGISRVEISGGIQASLGGRYASALFELARESKQIEAVEASLSTLQAAIRENNDLQALITSPLVEREPAARAIKAVAQTLALDPVTTNLLGVLAQNRRLAQVPAVVRAYRQLAAAYRGEITAEVASAHPLNDEQVAALKQKLKSQTGRDVAVDLRVDPALLGGLTVKIGSRLIDSSLRTKLNSLAQAMKG